MLWLLIISAQKHENTSLGTSFEPHLLSSRSHWYIAITSGKLGKAGPAAWNSLLQKETSLKAPPRPRLLDSTCRSPRPFPHYPRPFPERLRPSGSPNWRHWRHPHLLRSFAVLPLPPNKQRFKHCLIRWSASEVNESLYIFVHGAKEQTPREG